VANSNEENKVRDIDPPKNLSRKPSDPQASSILSDIGIESKEDKGTEDGNGDIKTLPALPNMFKENSVFSNDLLSLVQHKHPKHAPHPPLSPQKGERDGVKGL
jgi:hypothetical protein